MTSIKELLKRDIKNASRRIWKKAKTEIPPSEADELARLALEKSIGYKKLREITEMMPEIKRALGRARGGKPKVTRWGMALTGRLEKWENS